MPSSVKKQLKAMGRACQLCLFSGLAALSVGARAVQLDVMMLYDNGVSLHEFGNVQAYARAIVEEANIIYENSGVDIELRLVSLQPYAGNVQGSAIQVLEWLSDDETVKQQRDASGADFVSLSVLQLEDTTTCGTGWIGSGTAQAERDAYSVIAYGCGAITFVHELGHNMGLNHSWRQAPEGGGIYDYAMGYGVDAVFSTLMAYSSAFNSKRLSRFSDPASKCFDLPCGVPVGQPQPANAVLVLNQDKLRYKNFRPEKTFEGQVQFNLPAKVQAENFARGYDTTPGNLGAIFRVSDVDIQSTGEPGGFAVGWTEQGEWLEYDLVAAQSGVVNAVFQVSSLPGDAIFEVQMNGVTVAQVTVPATGAWDAYQPINVALGDIEAGTNTVRLTITKRGLNLDWIDFQFEPSEQTPVEEKSGGAFEPVFWGLFLGVLFSLALTRLKASLSKTNF